jgi:hypothetical protein
MLCYQREAHFRQVLQAFRSRRQYQHHGRSSHHPPFPTKHGISSLMSSTISLSVMHLEAVCSRVLEFRYSTNLEGGSHSVDASALYYGLPCKRPIKIAEAQLQRATIKCISCPVGSQPSPWATISSQPYDMYPLVSHLTQHSLPFQRLVSRPVVGVTVFRSIATGFPRIPRDVSFLCQ